MYKIIYVRPYTYLDQMSQPIRGFEVRFEISKSGEHHVIYVPTNNAEKIDREVRSFIAEREKLDSLGAKNPG